MAEWGSIGTAASNAGSTDVAVDAPSGLAVGDLMIAAIGVRAASATLSAEPSGWSAAVITNDAGADADATQIWSWKIATAADLGATFHWTLSASAGWHCPGIIRVVGANVANPINAADAIGRSAATSHATPTITPDKDGCLLIGIWNMGSGTATWTLDGSLTSRYNASLQSEVIAVGSVLQTSAASVSKTSTSSSGQDSGCLLIAVESAAIGIGSNSNVGNGTSLTFTSGENVPAGELVVLGIGWFHASATLQSVTDDAGNTYNIEVQGANGSDHCAIASLVLTNAITTSTVFTASWGATSVSSRFFCGAWCPGKGAKTGTAAGQSAANAGAWDSGSVACDDGGILVGASYNGNGFGNATNTPGDLEVYDLQLAGDSAFALVFQLGDGSSISADGTWASATGPTRSEAIAFGSGAAPPQKIRPDADNATGNWTTTPLWSKVDEDAAGGDVITDTAA